MFLFLAAPPVFEPLFRANVRIMLWLNGYLADHPNLLKLALLLVDRGVDILLIATLALLWFWPRGENNRSLFGDAPLSGLTRRRSPLRAFYAGMTFESPSGPYISREQSRAQLLVLCASSVASYFLARVIAFEAGVPRPIHSYWLGEPPAAMSRLSQSFLQPGAIPADHIALLASVCAGLFFWNNRLAFFWIAVAVVTSVCLIGIGIQYPIDLIWGCALGIACAWLPLSAMRQGGALNVRAGDLARAFDLENAPYCYLIYFVTALLLLEALSHFSHFVSFLMSMRGAIASSLGRGA